MQKYRTHSRLFFLTLVTSIALIIAGFLVPPTGVIDGSVLTAVGELFAFGALAQLPHLVALGKEVHFTHGNTTVTVGDGEDIAAMNKRHRRHRHDDTPDEPEPSDDEQPTL